LFRPGAQRAYLSHRRIARREERLPAGTNAAQEDADLRGAMTMIRVFAAVATAIALTTGALGAQTRDRPIFLVGNMGYGWDQPHGGFSLNAGAGVRSQKLFAYLLPLDMTFVQGKQNRQYIMQT
jgi:hypothetical protein